jgi:hypothetical protein
MAYASITYTSVSGTTFALTNSNGDPIEYLRQADIKVFLNGTLQTVTTDYTFNTAGTAIVFNTSVSGATVIIQRITNIDESTVDFTPGSTLVASDLNNSSNQNLFALQELRDEITFGGGVSDGDKGEIIVANSGTLWSIDTGVITSSKLASSAFTDSVSSTSTTTIATPNSVKTTYDAITNKLSKTGDTMTGVLGITAGTAAVPSVFISGDTNTGIYSPGADQLGFSTGGTGRLTIDASGNVNIVGTLTKGGNNVVSVADTGTVTSTMILDGTILNVDINASAAIAGTKVSPNFGSQNVVTTGTSTAASFIPTSSTAPATGVYLPGTDTFGISTNSTERFRVTTEGTQCFNQVAGPSYGTTTTLTAAEIKGGLVTSTITTGTTFTLPTGTDLDTSFSGPYTNMTFQWTLLNTGTALCTLAGNTGHTLIGTLSISADNGRRFATRRTGTNTYVSFRIG